MATGTGHALIQEIELAHDRQEQMSGVQLLVNLGIN
jgi:hypothetical protein